MRLVPRAFRRTTAQASGEAAGPSVEAGIALEAVAQPGPRTNTGFTETLTCNGDCCGLQAILQSLPDTREVPQVDDDENLKNPEDQEDQVFTTADQITYRQIQPWQTRLIRLLPDLHEGALAIELVEADLVTVPGLRLSNSNEVVQYTAVSYHWAKDDTATAVFCDGAWVRMGDNIVSAISQKRDPLRTVYLWLDALCIDQDQHNLEKSFQVANMLDIFSKAESITAWLGHADCTSELAVRCLMRSQELSQNLWSSNLPLHRPDCLLNVTAMCDALLALYQRSFLRRTWIRQELFAARAIHFTCGADQLSEEEYISGGQLLVDAYTFLKKDSRASVEVLRAVNEKLIDLQSSMLSKAGQWLRPRNLFEVLEQAKLYDCTLEQDTIYAIAAMCGIRTQTGAQDWNRNGEFFLIDYSRPPNRVYHDLSLWLLLRASTPDLFFNLWNYSIGNSPVPNSWNRNLPSWAVNWRHGRCTLDDRLVIDYIVQRRGAGPVRADLPNPYNIVLDLELPWMAPTVAEDDSILELHGRAIDYVAFVSGYTTSLNCFCGEGSRGSGPWLGEAGNLIHLQKEPPEGTGLFRLDGHREIERFDPAKHHRRLAIIGLARQVALVPPSTRKGDLIVFVGPRTIPLVLSPDVNLYSDRLYATPDPYERCETVPLAEPTPEKPTLSQSIGNWRRHGTTNRSAKLDLAFTMAENIWIALFGCFVFPIQLALLGLYPVEQPPAIESRSRSTVIDVLNSVTADPESHFRLVGPCLAQYRPTVGYNLDSQVPGLASVMQTFRVR